MKRIVLPSFVWPEPDPEDQFSIVEELTPEAAAELAAMREQVGQDKPQPAQDKKPASLDEQ